MGFDLVVIALDDVSIGSHQRMGKVRYSYCRRYTFVPRSANVTFQDCILVPRGPI